MIQLKYSLLWLIFLVNLSTYGFTPGNSENKDSILSSLVNFIKVKYPEAIALEHKDSIRFQSFAYLGYIINDDSVPTHRLIVVQTHFHNDSVDKRLLVFQGSGLLGYYHVRAVTPKKILNYRYLAFDKMTVDFNGHPVPLKVNFSHGVPEKFMIDKEELILTRTPLSLADQ